MVSKLSVRNLSVGYGSGPVLAGIDLQVQAGELWGVVGPNGAGKSTLLRTMSRSLAPLAGTVLLDEQDIAALPVAELARQLAFMAPEVREGLPFQVREFVAFGRTPHQNWIGQSSAADEAAVDRALAMTGTAALQARCMEDLSSGERQRVQLAMALAQEPQVLLLDEPTAHLDLNYQVELMRLLLQVAASGACIVAILHDLNLAAAYCHRLIAVHRGGAAGMGPPREVITRPIIAALYGDAVRVEIQAETGLPYVLPAWRPAADG